MHWGKAGFISESCFSTRYPFPLPTRHWNNSKRAHSLKKWIWLYFGALEFRIQSNFWKMSFLPTIGLKWPNLPIIFIIIGITIDLRNMALYRVRTGNKTIINGKYPRLPLRPRKQRSITHWIVTGPKKKTTFIIRRTELWSKYTIRKSEFLSWSWVLYSETIPRSKMF